MLNANLSGAFAQAWSPREILTKARTEPQKTLADLNRFALAHSIQLHQGLIMDRLARTPALAENGGPTWFVSVEGRKTMALSPFFLKPIEELVANEGAWHARILDNLFQGGIESDEAISALHEFTGYQYVQPLKPFLA